MKRIAGILLVFFYLMPAMGIIVSSHFCGGKSTAVSLGVFNGSHPCPCGNMPVKQNCCKDKITFSKMDDDTQKPLTLSANFLQTTVHLTSVMPEWIFSYPDPPLSFSYYDSAHPPDDLRHPARIRYSVFLI